jgi:hypothetical protein
MNAPIERLRKEREREREGERRLTGKRDEKLVVVDVEKL